MVVSKTVSKGHSVTSAAKNASVDPNSIRQYFEALTPMLAQLTEDSSKECKKTVAQLTDSLRHLQDTMNRQSAEIERLRGALEGELQMADHSRALEEAQALTHLGSWEWDIATGKISWSDELYRIYGMNPQEREISFEEFLGLIHPDDRKNVEDIIADSFKTGRPFEFEHRVILPAGDECILKGMGKTVYDSHGAPVRMLGTSQDITQAKQLDRAKDEFISLVSHQLRTPLTIVRIHGNILEDGLAGPLDPQQESHIRTMTSASIRLIELVDDILRISRISLNRIRINAAPTNPNVLIQTCIDEAMPMAKKKDTTLTFEADDGIGMVPIDTTIFGEILRNLVSNAVRYTKPANGKVAVQFKKEKDGFLLEVRDNGIGIPKADRSYIFERFYRANNATVVDGEGSGLGLYIVKLFTEAAGGKIWLESTVGKGTTFYVSFPFDGMKSRHADDAVE